MSRESITLAPSLSTPTRKPTKEVEGPSRRNSPRSRPRLRTDNNKMASSKKSKPTLTDILLPVRLDAQTLPVSDSRRRYKSLILAYTITLRKMRLSDVPFLSLEAQCSASSKLPTATQSWVCTSTTSHQTFTMSILNSDPKTSTSTALRTMQCLLSTARSPAKRCEPTQNLVHF